jgi:hypothetical protein
VFDIQDLGKWDKILNRIGIRDALNIDKESTSSSWFGPGNAYKFDPNYAVGRGNIAARMKQRRQAQKYLGNSLSANWALDRFNTNWEMAQGMSGIRTRTDKLLDFQKSREDLANTKEGQIGVQKFKNYKENAAYWKEVSKSPEGMQVIKELEEALGRTATDREKIPALKMANLEASKKARSLPEIESTHSNS